MTAHTVYIFRDAEGRVLYVGCTANIVVRLSRHRTDKSWFLDIATVACEHFPDKATALAREKALIADLAPVHDLSRGVPYEGDPCSIRCRFHRWCGLPASWVYEHCGQQWYVCVAHLKHHHRLWGARPLVPLAAPDEAVPA